MAQPKKRPFVSLKGLETGRVTSAGKPVYKYKGEEISEKSIDIEADGKTYVIPTVIDGKLYTEEAAVKKFFNKEVEPIKVLKENIKERSKKLAKGGTAMKRQMEMFEDGGLKDEGGMVDEVSGNDVPTGSTREEVRDDIPAQLSEGEFVFPADVVRFIGLEKLMRLRQEAKQGLKQMEAMGQMGNSDEATMPDDLPFDETDLDIDDDLEYNVGGYVAPQVPNVNESIETTSPMGMQQIQTGLGQMYTPTGQPQQTYAPRNYDQFLGPSAAGAPQTQTVRYFNKDTNQTRMIPHLVNADGSLGKTLYPVPDGFVREDEAPKEEAKTAVQSTKVKPVETGDGDGDSDVSTLGGARMDVGGKSFAIGYNFDGSITLTDPNTMESKTYDKNSQITKDAKAVTMGQMVELSKLTPAGIKTALVSSVADKLGVKIPGSTKIDDIKRKQKEAKNRLNKTMSGVGDDPSTGMSIEDMDTIQAGLKGKDVDKAEMQRLADKVSDIVDKSGPVGGSAVGSADSYTIGDTTYGDLGSQDDPGGSAGEVGEGTGYSEETLGGLFKQGGLAKRKTKVKKMKRGGLASKK